MACKVCMHSQRGGVNSLGCTFLIAVAGKAGLGWVSSKILAKVFPIVMSFLVMKLVLRKAPLEEVVKRSNFQL